MILKSLETKQFLVLIEIFSCFLCLLPLCSSIFHQTNGEIAQDRSEDIPFSPEFNRSIIFSKWMTMTNKSVVLTLDN